MLRPGPDLAFSILGDVGERKPVTSGPVTGVYVRDRIESDGGR